MSSNPMKTILCLIVAGLWTLCGQASGEVSFESPDLSMFKLRPVASRSRIEVAIVDLATGAEHMLQSLFVNAYNIRCPAYSHLFQLIEASLQQPADETRAIRQNVVEALAIVATHDRPIYHALFNQQLAQSQPQVGARFLEAAKLLESRQQNREGSSLSGAWFDLMQCMASYMSGDSEASAYLKANSKTLEDIQRFKAIPVERPVDSQWTPDGLVKNLVAKYSNEEPLSAEDYTKARNLIEALDTEQLAELRRKLAEGGEPNEPATDEVQETEPQQEDDTEALVDLKPPEVDLVYPVDDDDGQDKRDSSEIDDESLGVQRISRLTEIREARRKKQKASNFSDSKLAILKFIKMRINQKPAFRFDVPPKMPIQLAYDFDLLWQDLEDLVVSGQLDPLSSLGREARLFYETNQGLSQRMQVAISTYARLSHLVARMKLHTGNWNSIDEFEDLVSEISGQLDSMDPRFDVDDLRRWRKIWEKKLVEYKTLNKFINSDSW